MWRGDMAREGRAFHPLNVIMMTAAQANSPNARIAAITASSAPPSFQGSRSVGGLIEFANEPIKRSTGNSYSTFEYDIGDEDDCGECCQIRGKKRRLSSEQVRTLEKTFEMADKVEPEKKVQLARALGLQPRQIAVWFQNRRARWKTKQLEKDFDVLKHDYDALKADYDSLLEQNKSLQAKVQRLRSIKLQNQLDHEFECTQEEEPRANINTRVIKDHEGASSVGSEASTVWNTDSPGTINSHTPSPLPRGDSTGLKVSDRLPHIESNFNPKLKECVIPDGSSCDLLYNNLEDEQGALWWDYWPQSLEQIPLRI